MLGIQSLRLLRSGRAAGYWTRRSVIPGAFKTMTGDTSTAPAVNAAEVHVRPAAAADASSLASIINEAYRTTRGWTHEAHLVGGERISAAGVQEIISAGRVRSRVPCPCSFAAPALVPQRPLCLSKHPVVVLQPRKLPERC